MLAFAIGRAKAVLNGLRIRLQGCQWFDAVAEGATASEHKERQAVDKLNTIYKLGVSKANDDGRSFPSSFVLALAVGVPSE